MEHQYQLYTVQQFANDPYFWAWATGSDVTSDDFWQSFQETYPHKKDDIEKARMLVEELNESRFSLENQKVDQIWENITRMNPDLVDVDKKSSQPLVLPQKSRTTRLPYFMAAAVTAMMMLAGGYLIYQQFQIEKIATAYGQTLHVWLPDSSEVLLNGNSSIRFQEDWDGQEREVWIEGEAFFKVQHLLSNKKFTVHSGDVQVQVLGTEFTVNNRQRQTRVMLQKGKVALSINKPDQLPEKLEMQPGDLVEYTPSHREIVQKVVNPEKYASWTHNELIFDHSSLQDIFSLLRENYGYQILIGDQVDVKKQFTGKIPADKIEILLEGLRVTHHLKIEKNGQQLQISSQ